MNYKKKKCILSIFLTWFAYVQIVMPTLVLADEIAPLSEVAIPTDTEQMLPEPTPVSTIMTGDAYATTESLGITNTTTLNSEINVVQGDLTDPEQSDLTLFVNPSSSPSAEASASGELDLAITNDASSTVSATAEANTGSNEQDVTNDAEIITGEAVATAYATGITNSTLINSSVNIALMTIITDWDGNILLEPLSPKEKEALYTAVGNLQLDNTGEVITGASAKAETGENNQAANGNANLVTGSAAAVATSATLTNMTLIDAILFQFFVHNLSLWSGQVYNWETPGSRQTPQEVIGSHLLYGEQIICESGCQNNAEITNKSRSEVIATAYANTGYNSQSTISNGTIQTGNAFASAKAASVVNTTLINSQYNLIDLSLFAKWTGNLIFTYPDLEVTINAPSEVTKGEKFSYSVTIANNGYGRDTGIILQSDSGAEVIGNLEAFQSISRIYTINSAEVTGDKVTLKAIVGGEKTEETLANNTANTEVNVLEPEIKETVTSTSHEVSHDIPEIALSAKNNIATIIHPGDTATYEVILENNGPGKAYDTTFRNVFLNSESDLVGIIETNIGHLAEGERRTIKFGLATSSSLPPGEYYTISVASGRSDDYTPLNTNIVKNKVPVWSQLAPAAKALEIRNSDPATPFQGEILGKQTDMCATCRGANVLLVVTTAMIALYTYAGRLWKSKRMMRMAMGWSALGYTTLLVLNPDCSNGLNLISGTGLCKYFLPITIGEAIALKMLTSQNIPAYIRKLNFTRISLF